MTSTQQTATGNGWIKLHRTIMDWEWYQDHNTTRLFIHLLLKANHKPNKWRGQVVDTGTVITGRKALASETGLTEQQVRYSLTKLKRTGNVTIKTTNKYSIIEVKSWGDYQESNQQNPQSLTNNEPTSNQQVTTNKKVKNDKNEKKVNLIAFAQGLVSDEVRKALIAEWMEYKIEIKKPMNAERGVKSMITQWEPYTNEQIRDAMNYSMANNYTGIVFDKITSNSSTTKQELF